MSGADACPNLGSKNIGLLSEAISCPDYTLKNIQFFIERFPALTKPVLEYQDDNNYTVWRPSKMVIGHCYKVTQDQDVVWIRNPLNPVLYGWKEVQRELHPIPTTLKLAPESLMEIQRHRCLTNNCSTKKCPCTREEDFS